MIQLHRLEGFYWVAKTGGYSKAARAFPYPISQPAVHQQVKKLEGELGRPLFERVGRDRMVLTPAGRRLYEFAAPFFDELPAVVRALQSSEARGELRIETEALIIRHLLPSWLKRLRRKYPEIRIDLEEQAVATIDRLRSGETDLVVAYLEKTPRDIDTRQVGTLRPFIVMPANHRSAKKSKTVLSDFVRDTFISYNPGLLPYELQMQALAQHGVEPEQVLSASSAEAILGFVEAGLGFSIVPSLDRTGPKGRGIVARRLSAPKVEFPVVAAWRKSAWIHPLVEAALAVAPKL
ncbi:MAG: LysR family transcriptional regulator [Planctomycetota bacterium]